MIAIEERRETATREIIENDLYPEAFGLALLGDLFSDNAVKGTITFRCGYLRKNHYQAQKVRDRITKRLFLKLGDYTVKERMKSKNHKINYFLSWEVGAGSVHLHFMIYKEGFKEWNPEKIINWLKRKVRDFANAMTTDFGIHKMMNHKNGYASTFSRYINKRERSYNNFTKSYQEQEGIKFFSEGLKKTINEI